MIEFPGELLTSVMDGAGSGEGRPSERKTMRYVTDHIVEGDSVNHQVEIQVVDEPGAGGACHDYRVQSTYQKGQRIPMQRHMEDSVVEISADGSTTLTLGRVKFQNGPIKESGVNGTTQEVLLAIVIDRLRSFQSGPYACRDNAIALTHCEEALMWLQRRTRERIKRGVEGTHQK